jgi:hypothetical protein
MAFKVRVRNGMRVSPSTGLGGSSEGDLRGNSSDFIEQNSGVVDADEHFDLHETTPTPTMSVVLEPGIAYIPNSDFDEFDSDSIKFWEAVLDEAVTLEISPNSSGQVRVDAICAFMDVTVVTNNDASNVASIVVVEGTPGGGTPTIPPNHVNIREINVPNGATDIEDADIVDNREQVYFKNKFLPPDLGAKRIAKRTRTITTATTITPDMDDEDEIYINALASNLTINAPVGTFEDGKVLVIRIKDNGITRTLTWNAVFRELGAYIPTNTEAGLWLYVGAKWNASSSKWDVLMANQE